MVAQIRCFTDSGPETQLFRDNETEGCIEMVTSGKPGVTKLSVYEFLILFMFHVNNENSLTSY